MYNDLNDNDFGSGSCSASGGVWVGRWYSIWLFTQYDDSGSFNMMTDFFQLNGNIREQVIQWKENTSSTNGWGKKLLPISSWSYDFFKLFKSYPMYLLLSLKTVDK